MRRLPGFPVLLAATLLAGCAGSAPTAPAAVPVAALPPSTVGPLPAPPTEVDAAKIARVRALLRQLHRDHLSSTVRMTPAGELTTTDRLRQEDPAAALSWLQRQGDAAVFDLGGTFYAILANDLGIATSVAPVLCDLLRDADPRRVAFACEAFAGLGWADAKVHLQPLLQDRTAVPGYGTATVADFAALALQQLGEPQGKDH